MPCPSLSGSTNAGGGAGAEARVACGEDEVAERGQLERGAEAAAADDGGRDAERDEAAKERMQLRGRGVAAEGEVVVVAANEGRRTRRHTPAGDGRQAAAMGSGPPSAR